MTVDQQALWQRLQELRLDDPAAAQPFSVRLARENGWSLRFSQRVVEEYQRFLLLATTAGPACPSEAVDEAWHLHLCYTRSYWNDLCRDLLGQPLHHLPTEGGAEQLAHHCDMYAATLANYRRTFNREPPADIWPDAEHRFANRGAMRVERSHYWLVPKPQLAAKLRKLGERLRPALWLGGIAVLPMLGANFNPLDFSGVDFLKFYAITLAATIVGGLAIRRILRMPDDQTPLPQLDAYECAVLAGGEELAMQVAVSELVVGGQLSVNKQLENALTALPPEPVGSHPLLRATYEAVARRTDAGLLDAFNGARPEAAKLGARLEERKLLETKDSSYASRWAPALLMSAVFVLGAAKVIVGASRGKPVGFLVVMCIAAAIAAALFLKPIVRTLRGERLLRRLQEERNDLNSSRELFTRPPQDVAWGLALFGIGAMAMSTDAVADLYRWMKPRDSGGDGGGSGTVTSCGADGGGGGCGGGGCGGCGGD